MAMTDPVADMLTRLRNGLTAKHDTVIIPASKMKLAIANILVDEGYIKSAAVQTAENGVNEDIKVELKYGANNAKVISGLKKISKPGLRVYVNSDKLPRVLNGLGIAIISTSKGVMTDKKARELGVGGEVLAYIW